MYRETSWFTVHGSQRVRHNWVTYTFCFTLCPWMFSSVSYFTVYGNLNRIFILLLCENCINLNYIELCFSGQLYPSTSLLIFLLSTFESLILKLKLKCLIYLLKKIMQYTVELYVTLLCILQLSLKCFFILS